MRRALLTLLSVFAAVAAAPAAGCQPEIAAVERALNALRAKPQVCGDRSLPAAPALRWQALLAASAQHHALDLAARDRLDHLGADGASLRTRVRSTGYAMRLACENLMAADFQEFGLACVTGPGRLQRYWVLQLAAPARAKP